MTETATRDCRRNSWLVALAGGVLVALMLLILAQYGVLKALVIGALVTVLLGVFLVWAFCPAGAAGDAEAETRPEPRPAVPVPGARTAETVIPPAPAPEPAPQPAPERITEPVAPPAFVSTQPAVRPEAPAAAVSAVPAAAEPPARRRRGSAAGLDAALAKSKDAPPAPVPGMLAAPRGGDADDLKLIRGIGPKLEALLNGMGVWHFDQIAAWKARDIAQVDERLVGFHGRITRDEWVKQARALAAGGTPRGER